MKKQAIIIVVLLIAAYNSIAQTTEVWKIKAPMPTARARFSAVVVDSIIYVIGGSNSIATLNVVEAYNPVTNTWTTKAPMPTARGELAVTAVNGKIYAIGGYFSSVLNTVEEYDPVTDTWATKASMPTARSLFSVGVIGNNIYAVGGFPGNIATLEVYDQISNAWSTKASLPIGRQQINGCAVINGKLHLIGGKNDLVTTMYADNYVYDTLTNSWSSDTSLPFARFGGAATVLNNEIYYFGGAIGTYADDYTPNYSNNNYFDSITHTWQSRLQMLNKRSGMIAATVKGKVYIIGGSDSISEFNVVNWNHEYSIDHAPSFSGGHSQSLSVCENAIITPINSLLAVIDSDAGDTEAYTVISGATHGALIATYTTTSTGSTITPAGLSYTPSTGYSGIDSFKVKVSDGVVADTTTIYVTINPLPNAGTITAASSLCESSFITLSDTVTGGTWGATNTDAVVSSSGLAYGIAAGIDTVKYIVSNTCGIAIATKIITIDPLPEAGAITGLSAVCVSSSITLATTVPGGIWNASNANASVIGGVVTGVISGMDTINYTVSNTCGIAIVSKIICINPLPNTGTITGLDTVCIGDDIPLISSYSGGTWSVSNANAIVSSSGDVYGIVTGADTIIYTVTNSCGTMATEKQTEIIDCTTGVKNLSQSINNLIVFPNPAQNNITITSSIAINNVVISNIVGQTVFSGYYNTNSVSISLTQLSDGIYFLKVNNNKVYKVIKQ